MSKSVQFSAVIITYNEEKNIARCLDSILGLADEIIVVDSNSQDKTAEICIQKGARVFSQEFMGYTNQKNYALSLTKNNCILSLDADEELSNDLKDCIYKIKKSWEFDAYSFNRLTYFCGKWINHCGWYPDKRIRLWNRQKGKWMGGNLHEKVVMQKEASIKHFNLDILHYSFYTIYQHLDQINKYSELAAKDALNKRKKCNVLVHIIFNPVFTFLKKYCLQLGFRDGWPGFIICANTAYSKFLKYIKLRQLHKEKNKDFT